MAQTAAPTSDVTDGLWTDQAGGTSLFAAIDEAVADDLDYIKSSDLDVGQSDACEIALGPITDPVSGTGHVVRYRYRAQGTTTINLVVTLLDGATTIATWTHTSVGSTYADAEQTLSAGEANAITNYADLRLRFNAVCPSGDAALLLESGDALLLETGDRLLLEA